MALVLSKPHHFARGEAHGRRQPYEDSDSADEFSLLDKTALLFRMLLAGPPEACCATSLLWGVCQNKGAATLGQLEMQSIAQVLYFIPSMRKIMLEVPPDPAEEFSLLDETALLFRMLLAGGPEACQATNLLRALRQNKGAAALGLLETHEQRSGENSDIEVISTNHFNSSCFFH